MTTKIDFSSYPGDIIIVCKKDEGFICPLCGGEIKPGDLYQSECPPGIRCISCVQKIVKKNIDEYQGLRWELDKYSW